jgi:prepilin-type N-terminal cleavage/methylation domain-containing protein
MPISKRFYTNIFNNYGFTLIELLAVLMIMSIVLSLSWPALDKMYQRYALNTATTDLAWTLRSARSYAMFSGKPVTVRFYVAANTYMSPDGWFQLTEGIKYAGVPTFPSTIGGIPVCSFSASGAPSGGGTIVLKNKLNMKKYIIVNPVVGKIRVSDTPPASW